MSVFSLYERLGGRFYLEDRLRGYILELHENRARESESVRFSVVTNKPSRYHDEIENRPIIHITAREMDRYRKVMGSHALDPSLQYLEVGPGLAGFLEKLSSLQEKSDIEMKPLPIAIDIADYSLMEEMLTAGKLIAPKSMHPRIDILIKRCHLILDPKRVRLINIPVELATLSYPDISRNADVVVSNIAAGHYAANDRSEYITSCLQELLKPKGVLLVNDGKIDSFGGMVSQ